MAATHSSMQKMAHRASGMCPPVKHLTVPSTNQTCSRRDNACCNITTSRFSYRLSLLTRPIPSRSVQRHTIANTCTHSHENKLQIQIVTLIKVSCSNRTQYREASHSYSIGWQGVVCNTSSEIIPVLFNTYPIWSMDGGRNHSMGSSMDGTPPQSEDQ